MTHETKMLAYSNKLGADEQVSMEEMISARIFDEVNGLSDPVGEEDCNALGREILYNVLRKFRPDLFEQELTCYNCKWKGYESDMEKTVAKGNVPDLYERTDDGADSAVGECPECGALIEEA